MSLRKDVSNIVNFTVLPGKWSETFDQLDKEGRITRREIIQILLLLLEREEARENER